MISWRQLFLTKTVLLVSSLLISTAGAADLVKPQPKKKITLPAVRIAYKHRVALKNGVTMSTPRVIDRANKNPGAMVGATLDFAAVLLSASGSLPSSRYTWTGAATGTGPEIAAAFNATGLKSITLTILDKNSNTNKSFTANTRVRFLGAETEPDLCLTPEDFQTADFCALGAIITNKAITWSELPATAVALGFPSAPCTFDDGKCNAARHSYWNLLLRRDLSDAFAERLTNAHERASLNLTGLNHGGAHNACVMDLDNNAVGRTIVTELITPITDSAAQSAIIFTANETTRLTKLDTAANANAFSPPDTNPQGSGLLEPSNQ